MPLFFFDICEDGDHTQLGSTEFEDDHAAHEYATGIVQSIFSGRCDADVGSIVIRDAAGLEIGRVRAEDE